MQAPRKLHNSRSEHLLIIDWPNGEQHSISHLKLRAACRCASCRGRVIDERIFMADADLTLEKIQPMHQGLQLVFSDGHERGIYPWDYLYGLG